MLLLPITFQFHSTSRKDHPSKSRSGSRCPAGRRAINEGTRRQSVIGVLLPPASAFASEQKSRQLVLALVMSRLDYCNAVLAVVPQSTLEPLQRVQNATARLVHQLDVRDYVTPSLMVLYWLPIRCHIDFKLCTIIYGIHTGRCPAYLKDIICTSSSTATRTGLRSASSNKYVMPQLQTKCQTCCIRAAASPAMFKKLLKMHLFNTAFSTC